MRLHRVEIDKPIQIYLNNKIEINDYDLGYYNFGEFNDYPQIIELLVNNSITARTVADMYARFLIGNGFENELINTEIIGQDVFGRNITVIDLLRYACKELSINQGFSFHFNFNAFGEIGKIQPKPFKNFRLGKRDDLGYIPKVLYNEKWIWDVNIRGEKRKVNVEDVTIFDLFNPNKEVFNELVNKSGGDPLKYNGQIYYASLDKQFLYPLSIFNPVYLELDNDYQIELFKNRQLRNGFLSKLIFHIRGGSDEENKEQTEDIKKFIGVDGDSCLVIAEDINDMNNIEGKNSLITEKIDTSINDKLFENWNKDIINNIRKAGRNIPQILIDYESSSLGTTSGESLSQAVAFYNVMTADDRKFISNCFAEFMKKSVNKTLRNNENWNIDPITISEDTKKNTVKDKKQESQAVLRGSVGGVQAILNIQKSVSAGLTDYNSAIAIMEEIFGIGKKKAAEIIGEPKEVPITQPVNV